MARTRTKDLTYFLINAIYKSSIPKGAAPAFGVFCIKDFRSKLPGYREVSGAPFGRRHSLGLFLCPKHKRLNQEEVTP